MREGWTYKTFGEVSEIICGQDYKSVQDENGAYPIYGTGGIMGYASQYRCPANSIIIGRKGSINNPILVEEPFWNVDTAFGVVPNISVVVPKYFYYFCRNYDFTKHDVSVTIPSLRRTDILKIEISVPPLPEQERIVAELDLLTGIIDKQKAQLKELDTLAQSIFFDMFGDPVENEKGWATKQLRTIIQVKGRVGWKGYKKEDLRDSGPLAIGGGHITDSGEIDLSNPVFLSQEKYEESPEIMIETGDLILVQRGTIGKVGLIKYDIGQATINPCVLILRPYSINNVYALHFFLSKSIQECLKKLVRGVAQPMITQQQVNSIEIPVPPLLLQQSFAQKIQSIESQKASINRSIEETQKLFDYTMDKYFG